MLSKNDLQIISTVFGKTVEEISGAISNEEEKALDLRLKGKVYSTQEIDDMRRTLTDAGVEIGMKNIAKAAKINLEAGEKKPEIIAQKITDSITATLEEKYKNPEPGEELTKAIEKHKEWELKYNKLSETHETKVEEIDDWKDKYETVVVENANKSLNEEIMSAFPEKMKMDLSDALLITRNNLKFEKNEDDKRVIKRGGDIVLDAVGNPETLKNVVKSFVEEKKWIKVNGMGGDDRQPGGGSGLPTGMTNEDATKYLEEKGIEPMSTKGSDMFVELTKKT